MQVSAFRRIVTGHDDTGKAIILSDAPPARVVQVGGEDGATFYEVWNTRETPAEIDRGQASPKRAVWFWLRRIRGPGSG
jgi:hypothetical protein